MDAQTPVEISAEAYLRRLFERGVEHVFVNPGTDFAPIVEALSRQAQSTLSAVRHRAP